MARELAKVYDPKTVEDRTYAFWQEGNFFHAEIDHEKEPYTIVIPPPNITGQLHMGHALDETFQDVLIRWRRMQGRSALWLPGTDHASIATEAKIVAAMKEEGLTKEDLGREKFLERAWAWKEKYGGRIVEQLKKLGSSCDWERERFTLDEGCNRAVNEVFCRLYEKGIIYRGERIINWCPHCLTSISDAEVEYEDQAGHFWHVRYPIVGMEGQYIEIATTRPETMLGDTAVAVNPGDERYKHLVGKMLLLPLVNKEIPLIADEYVEQEFGTGCVKITPAHDPNDYEVGLRHSLPVINIMNEDGTINQNGGRYAGMDRYAARKAIVAELEAQGYLVRVEDYSHNVGCCYRCGTTVEPLVSKQWFVKMEPLAKPAIEAVKSGETKFVPERFDKTYFHWMENIKDWCISRQLWWGHRIPAWYCPDCGELIVARETPEKCPKCGSARLEQDPDTLDTWFSSALWPFSTLGWPEKTPELDYFYPTSVLVTAYDIIFFWVSRMIFSGCEQMKKYPFEKVFIHGLVRDDKGRKMSKSLGNGIEPLEIADKYGADALRFNLITGNSPGNDMRFFTEKCEAMRNFANKIWNASRFVMMNLTIRECVLPGRLEQEDKWILSKLNRVVKEVTENMDAYELGVASAKVYDFIWSDYCDWYIELTKARLQGEDQQAKIQAQQVLVYVLTETLKLLHPFMPFLTEEIWQALPREAGCQVRFLMLDAWPVYRQELDFPQEEKSVGLIIDAVRAIRGKRAELNVPPSKRAHVTIATLEQAAFPQGAALLKRLAWASEVSVIGHAGAGSSDEMMQKGLVELQTYAARIFLPLAELVDLDKERARVEKELKKNAAELDKLTAKLGNPGFVGKAPQHVVEAERDRAAKLEVLVKKLEAQLAAM